MNNELKEIITLFSLVLIGSILWYQYWVKPNTERMYSIMDCMTEIGDHTEHGYMTCADQINEVR